MLEFELKDRKISTSRNAFVVGIINANNDSFWKKSRGGFNLAKKLIEQGADILDIGAESSRPGAEFISEYDELKKLIPLVKKIRKVSNIPISIDTRKKNVIKACVDQGADILNDISALEDDEQMVEYVSKEKIPVILMHKRKNPVIMQEYTNYENVFNEVNDYLLSRIQFAIEKGRVKPKWFEENTIHLHIPEGATPKDGPSAGITMATTFTSLLWKKTIKPNLAMTGELSLTGQVLPIGGLREKTVAAKRNKIKTIIIPKANERDLDDIPENVKAGIRFVPVSNISEVLEEALKIK